MSVIGQNLLITSGPGTGQLAIITGASYASGTTTYTLNINLAVSPTVGSNFDICTLPSNLVMYQNTLTFRTDSYAADDLGSDGYQPFQSAYQVAFDDNTVENTKEGVALWDFDEHAPVGFIDVVNNTFSGVQYGVRDFVSELDDPQFIGVVVRNNTMSGATTGWGAPVAGVEFYQNSSSGSLALSVVEHNTISDFPNGITVGDDPNTLIYKNTFSLGTASYSGSYGINFAASSPAVLLQENSYSGFATTYSTTSVTITGDTPLDVVYLASNDGSSSSTTIELLNDGPASLSWSLGSISYAGSSSGWLSLSTSSGSIDPESETPTSGSGSVAIQPPILASGCRRALPSRNSNNRLQQRGQQQYARI